MVPEVAVMFVVDIEVTDSAVARPQSGDALLIVATVVLDDFQVTCDVMILVEPSLNVPVAVNC